MYLKKNTTFLNNFLKQTYLSILNISKFNFIGLLIFISFIIWFKLGYTLYNNLFSKFNENWYLVVSDNLGYKLLIAPLWFVLVFKNIMEYILNTIILFYYPSFIPIPNVLKFIDPTSMETFIANDRAARIKLEHIFLPNEKYYKIFLTSNLYSIINEIINFKNLFTITPEQLHKYPLFLYFGFLFLLTTLFSLLFLSYLGLYGVFILNLISITLFWFSMLYYFNLVISNNYFYYINLGKWMHLSNGFQISFDILIDITSLSFSFLTLTIGFFVYIYTFSYFRYEPLVERLILFLNSFMISMILLVSSGNFITLFLGWELIGLTSFFLINFWSTRVGTLKSAFKAFSFNKLSDLFLFFAILLIYNSMYNLDILSFNNQIFLYENYLITFLNINFNLIEVISFFFLSCAFIKSAQIGGHLWLPDSMEAPIPASALIHSATLVSAGIYLLLRLTPLFELSWYAYYIIPLVGSITALYGGVVSAFQADTKKTLAYSTISHCGFLMVVYSTGVLEFVILYLYVHGFFKAATFLCVGNVNRLSRNIQDFKRMGGFYKYLPFECLTSFICIINLSGLPLTLGFYTKHLLFIGLHENYTIYYIIYSCLILAASAGVFYSYRLFYSVFFDTKKGKKTIYYQANRNNLNSKFYSNSSLASNISISILVIVSYFVTLYLYNIILNKFYNISDLKTININNALSYLYQPDINSLNNISILNWLVIVALISVIFINWRQSYYFSQSIDSLSKFILFSFFFFLFAKYVF